MSASGTGRKFHFIREIASGGFGSVYLAKVIHGDGFARLAAVKLLHPKWSENAEIASRMRDEARLLGWLRHRHIVEVLDLTRIDGRVAVIMEYLEAVDLKVAASDRRKAGEVVPVRACLDLGAAVASALDAAYNRPPYAGEKPLRVIHRDIKPSNVMVDTSGLAKVLDFGVARADFEERESHTQEMSFGSIEYMPPERLFFEPESPSSDIYSLGATLYEMLALERFGKAQLHPDQHEEFLIDRYATLLERRRERDCNLLDVETSEVADFEMLVGRMLAFDEADRPSAAECVTTMRKLARRFPDEGLGEWAERVVPPLVQVAQATERKQVGDTLVDRVITEDARAFPKDDDSEVRERTGEPPPVRRPRTEEDGLDETGRMSDQKWAAIKEATLAELEVKGPRAEGEAPPPKAPKAPPPPPPFGASAAPAGTARPQPVAPSGTARPQPAAPEQAPPSATPTVSRPSPPRGVASPPARPPTPVARPPRTERRGGGWGFILISLAAGFVMLVIGVGLIAVVVLNLDRDVEPTEPTALAEVVPAEQPAAPEGPAARFISSLADTRRITVRCDGGEGDGQTEAVVAGESQAECVVTAVSRDRTRATAMVQDVEPRTYHCFEDGSRECR